MSIDCARVKTPQSKNTPILIVHSRRRSYILYLILKVFQKTGIEINDKS